MTYFIRVCLDTVQLMRKLDEENSVWFYFPGIRFLPLQKLERKKNEEIVNVPRRYALNSSVLFCCIPFPTCTEEKSTLPINVCMG